MDAPGFEPGTTTRLGSQVTVTLQMRCHTTRPYALDNVQPWVEPFSECRPSKVAGRLFNTGLLNSIIYITKWGSGVSGV